MGFLGPEKTVLKELSLNEDPRSNIDTPKEDYKTSVPKVYAAGGKCCLLHLVTVEARFPVL